MKGTKRQGGETTVHVEPFVPSYASINYQNYSGDMAFVRFTKFA